MPSLQDLLPHFSISVQQLGAVAQGLGLDQSLLKELEGMQGTLEKLRAVQAPAPPEPAEQPAGPRDDPDLMEVDAGFDKLSDADLRSTLSELGQPQPPDASVETMRDVLKRFQETLGGAHKKARTQ